MRDLVAGLVALLLLMAAASLATALRAYRQRRQRARDSERALGRTIIAELPHPDDLVLVSEDEHRFYYGEQPIDKDRIVSVRLLVNGAAIAAEAIRPQAAAPASMPTAPAGQSGEPPEGLLRDRWDVEIETASGTTLIECGAIRDRVSQELARTIFEAVRKGASRGDR
jgi:hypothetical protein